MSWCMRSGPQAGGVPDRPQLDMQHTPSAHARVCHRLCEGLAGCSPTCDIPDAPTSPSGAAKPARSAAEWRAQWECQLSGLPDLDQKDEAVQNETLHWLDWYFYQFRFDGMRVDAMGHVDPVRGPGPRCEPSFCCTASAYSVLACGRHVACESNV